MPGMSPVVLIMAGGSGTRLWPISRPTRAKQFAPVVGETTLLEQTYQRVRVAMPDAEIFVNVTDGHQHWVHRLLPDLPAGHVIAAPEDRDTLPTLGYATLAIERMVPSPMLVMLASDNFVRGAAAFRSALLESVAAAGRGPYLVSIGVRPTTPNTQYGYMQLGERTPFGEHAYFGVGYLEKPDVATARRLVEGGMHDWNSGMFAWTATTFWSAVRAFAPESAALFDELRTHGASCPADVQRALFSALPRLAVDQGLLEHVGSRGPHRHVFVRADFEWDDVGTYESVARHLTLDPYGNRVRGPVEARDTRACTLINDGSRRLEVHGLRDTIVVCDAGDLLVADRASHARVRELAGRPLWNGVDSSGPATGTNALAGYVKCIDSRDCVLEGQADGVVALVDVAGIHVGIEPDAFVVSALADRLAAARPGGARSLPQGLRLTVSEDHAQMSARAADQVVSSIERLSADRRGSPLVMFSAGSTPLQMFELLRTKYRTAVDWSRVRLAQMDEYVGVTADRAYANLLRRELVEPLGIREFMSIGSDWDLAALRDYEGRLRCDRLDLVVHGIGANGHLGFNEPGSDLEGSCAIAALAPTTRDRAVDAFGSLAAVPACGLTLGLDTLNQARSVVLMASSAAKASALRAAIFGPVSNSLPASSLQTHPDVSIHVDRDAARGWLWERTA